VQVNVGGIILILVGVVFLLQNFGILAWGEIWRFWPLILVAVGISMLVPKKKA
jgi:hypothetical protein